MSPKQKPPAQTFENATATLQAQSFDVRQVAGVANQVEIRKHGCGAVLARKPDGGPAYISGPGCLIGGEIALIVDRGFQKLLATSKIQVAATAQHLRALHDFREEVDAAIGRTDFYNLALGTVSDLYLYDRVKGREPESEPHADAH